MSDLESTHTEEAGDFVRPFVVTGGRTRSRVDGLRFETLVQATGLSGHDLRFETSRVHALCTDAIAIAELSAHLAIPTGTIKVIVGDLIQTAQAFGRLQDNLSFFRNIYDSFATYRATLERLSGFDDAIDAARAMELPHTHQDGGRLALLGVTVNRPDGHALIRDLNLEVAPGQPLLVRGPSGSGKTTLLRMIAGIWPHGSGEIIRPDTSALFLAQKPYLPLGTLRQALHYPQPADAVPAGQDEAILDRVQLGHLRDRLDVEDDWSRILSLGEQQRLAFGRLLIARPQAAFLDEATSAMDESLEDAMYRLLREQLPDARIISVGHRGTLRRHHGFELSLQGESGGWTLSPIE